jgi:lauroyl/myristoyl acyltransferase
MNAFLVATKVSRRSPRWFVRGAARLGADAAWLRKGKATRRLEDNLTRVTGLTGRPLRRLSRASLASTARYYAETLELRRMTGEQIDARVRVEDPHGAIPVLQARGGASLALSHSGNWDLIGAYTCRNIAPVTSVAEVLEPRAVFEEFVALRSSLGMRILGHEGSATFRALLLIAKRDPDVIALLADRDLSGSGVEVSMWGHRVKVAPGPAALARAAGTPLIPVFVHYERLFGARKRAAGSAWGSVLRFGAPVEPDSVTGPDAVSELSQQWAAWMAEQVASQPQDWHMLQRFGWVE